MVDNVAMFSNNKIEQFSMSGKCFKYVQVEVFIKYI